MYRQTAPKECLPVEEPAAAPKNEKRLLSVIGGLGLILLGIALLVLPGPGKLCILAGVVMVGEGLGFNTKEKLKEKIDPLLQKMKEKRRG